MDFWLMNCDRALGCGAYSPRNFLSRGFMLQLKKQDRARSPQSVTQHSSRTSLVLCYTQKPCKAKKSSLKFAMHKEKTGTNPLETSVVTY
jgi:hypothetical protein